MALQNVKIMVVEDDECFREFLIEILKHAGYEIIVAENGKKAFDLLKNNSLDVIISDIEMPVMDGISLLKEVKSVYPDMKMLMISGHPSYESIKVAQSLNVDIIDKSALSSIVTDKIDNLLNPHS